MKGESAISSWQLAVLLARVMQFFWQRPRKNSQGRFKPPRFLPVSVVASAFAFTAAYCLLRRYPGKGLWILQGKTGAGVVCPAAFFSFFSLCVLIQTTCAFSHFLTSVAYAQTSPRLFILLLLAVGGYTASMGYEPTARFGSFVLVAFVIALLFVGISLWPQAQWEFLRPPSCDGWQNQMFLFINLTLGNVETSAL